MPNLLLGLHRQRARRQVQLLVYGERATSCLPCRRHSHRYRLRTDSRPWHHRSTARRRSPHPNRLPAFGRPGGRRRTRSAHRRGLCAYCGTRCRGCLAERRHTLTDRVQSDRPAGIDHSGGRPSGTQRDSLRAHGIARSDTRPRRVRREDRSGLPAERATGFGSRTASSRSPHTDGLRGRCAAGYHRSPPGIRRAHTDGLRGRCAAGYHRSPPGIR